MQTLKKVVLRSVIAIAAIMLGALWLAFFSARPPLTIDPATLAGDGSTINYCELPALDGSGKLAADIAKGNTPGCHYDHFPPTHTASVYGTTARKCRRPARLMAWCNR